MKQDILICLFRVQSASAGEVAQMVGKHPRNVQELLIEMDDDGDVLMKNGMYRLSAVARSRASKRFGEADV